MAQPFNYTINLPDPAAAVTGGLQQGVQLASMMERADLLAAQRRQTDLENAALRAKAQMLKDQQDAVKAFYETPSEKRTAADYERLTATLPKEQAENIRAGFEAKTKEQQKQELLFGGQVFAALRNKDTGTASQMLIQKADAFEAAGDKAQAQAYRNAADMSLIAPDQAELFVGTTLSALPGGKEFIDNVGKQQAQRFEAEMQPFKVKEQAGKAEEAEVKGRFAERTAKSEIKKSEAAAQASLASASRAYEEAKTEKEARSAKIEGMVAQAALNRAQAQRQLAEAKTEDDMREARIALTRATADAKAASAKMSNFKPATKAFEAASTAAGTTADTISTINKLESLINKPSGAFGTVLDRMTGPAASRAPSVFSESRDVDALLSQLTAQAFLDKIPVMRGTGPLSDAEGKKLSAAAGNLTLNQSPAQFRATLAAMKEHAQKIQDEAQKTITKYNQDYGEAPTPAAPAGGGGGVAGMSDDELKKLLGL
jgi:hypothetical protein